MIIFQIFFSFPTRFQHLSNLLQQNSLFVHFKDFQFFFYIGNISSATHQTTYGFFCNWFCFYFDNSLEDLNPSKVNFSLIGYD